MLWIIIILSDRVNTDETFLTINRLFWCNHVIIFSLKIARNIPAKGNIYVLMKFFNATGFCQIWSGGSYGFWYNTIIFDSFVGIESPRLLLRRLLWWACLLSEA
jgi:hypothetical protein